LVFFMLVIGGFLALTGPFSKSSANHPCVKHQLSIRGHYSAAGIVAALNAYPKQYNGPDTAPSVNEIEHARAACVGHPTQIPP
jgi:hypothetical protein